MEKHAQPIDFRNLTPEMFIKHMDYRIEYENASAHALAHKKKAIIMFLRAFGQYSEEWKILCKTPPVEINEDTIEIPFPNEVNQLYKAKYSNNRYENGLFQSIVFIGFNFGMRPPSEIVNLNIGDIKINSDGTGYIKITEKKKRNKTRIIIPYNKKILSSKAYKTPKNYRDNWRYKVVTRESGDAFFLQPDGRPITENYVRAHLSPNGKIITKNPKFKPYNMRHTFATYYYQLTKNLKKVSKKLGHTKTVNTDKYVDVAEDLEEQFNGKNLFNIALKPHNIIAVGGKQNKQVTLSYPQKRGSTQSD
jgi:site-specific recombinase XerD